MSDDFPRVSGLQLTPKDLYALGTVIAHWAIAEMFITTHVYKLSLLTPNPANRSKPIRQAFGRMREQWKTLLAEVCGANPQYLKIGLALASASKVLKEDRDAAAHWPASRGDPQFDVPLKFVHLDIAKRTRKQKNFTPEELLALAERIYQLGSDVNFFDFAMFCDLFPSQCTWHGPKPKGPILRTHRFPTIEKPLRPQPTSRK
ncbi:MAG: hypothetical protein IH999_04490 [Proteobacteria bacterium]|nr:hypothetical protein [Pseudomonadota bacterium]